jgi:integrase
MRPRKNQRELPACVYHRHGAFWFVKRGKWTRLGDKWPGDAREEYDRLTGPAKGGMDKWVDEALEAHRKSVKASTFKQYGWAASKLKAAFAEFSPEQVKQKHVALWRRSMADTPNMANRCLSVARVVFSYLVEQQVIDSNPAQGVKPFLEVKRERLLSAEEFTAIYDKAVPRLQSMMELMFLCGQRLMDIVTIHESQIGPEGISFRQAKTGNRLLVRWTPEIREAVDRARALNKVRSLTLYRGRLGSPPKYRSVYVQWTTACRSAGVVDAQARDVRAMSATEANAQGKDATKLLGHASAAMTARYLRNRTVPQVDGPSIGQALNVGQTKQEKQ